MEMVPVKSSNLASVGYDPDRKVLRVSFLNGKSFDYKSVRPTVFSELLAAESAGKFFHAHVRSAYEYEPVTEKE